MKKGQPIDKNKLSGLVDYTGFYRRDAFGRNANLKTKKSHLNDDFFDKWVILDSSEGVPMAEPVLHMLSGA